MGKDKLTEMLQKYTEGGDFGYILECLAIVCDNMAEKEDDRRKQREWEKIAAKLTKIQVEFFDQLPPE